jgi:hypothetical protein
MSPDDFITTNTYSIPPSSAYLIMSFRFMSAPLVDVEEEEGKERVSTISHCLMDRRGQVRRGTILEGRETGRIGFTINIGGFENSLERRLNSKS